MEYSLEGLYPYLRGVRREQDYIRTLYGIGRNVGKAGYIKLKNGRNQKGIYPSVSLLAKEDFGKCFENFRVLDGENQKMSLCSYEKKRQATEKNIVNVFGLRISIRCDDNQKETVEEILDKEFLTHEKQMPVPTYLETGKDIQLIYIFSSPVCLRIRNSKKRKSVVRWLKRIKACLEERLQEILPECEIGKERSHNRLTDFVRVPYSKEIHYKMEYDRLKKRCELKTVSHNTVDVCKMKGKNLWEVHELSDAILPPLYAKRPTQKREVKISIAPRKTKKDVMEEKMELLRTLQKRGWDEGHREVMCFIYQTCCANAGYSFAETLEKIEKFNENFQTPLEEKEVFHAATPKKRYEYSYERILKVLDVPAEMKKELLRDKKAYDKAYAKAYREKVREEKEAMGICRWQKKYRAVEEALRLRALGHSVKEIAEKLKVCARTAFKYLEMGRLSLAPI